MLASEIAKELKRINVPQKKAVIYPQNSYMNYLSGRSGGAKWDNGLSASGANLTLDHNLLRQNARNAYFDSPSAKAIVSRIANSVSGTGIAVEPSPKNELLGIELEEAEKWSEQVSSRFDLFARSKLQHRAEQMSLYQASRFYEICNQRDGEVFVRLYYATDKNLLNPVQFEFIEPNAIRGSAFTNVAGKVPNYDGIDRDKRGRAKSYNITVHDDTTGKYSNVKIPAKSQKTGRVFMLHGYSPEFPGQTRGFSKIGHILQEFENITDFTLAQIKKAINQSNINMYVKPSKDAPSSAPFDDILTQSGAGPTSNPTVTPAEEQAISEFIKTVNYCPLPEATTNAPGSVGVYNLEQGEDLRPFENSAPSENFDSFTTSFISHLAASSSVPIEVLLQKFNSNYSASRAALILFWQVAQIWREEQVTDFLAPVYEMWLSEEIARGTISAPGWFDPLYKAAWLNARWIGPAMPNIDPLKTYMADKGYIEIGATNQDRVARDFNGSSGKANRAINQRTFNETPVAPWNMKEQPQDTGDKKDE